MIDVIEGGFDAVIRYGGTVPEDMVPAPVRGHMVVAGSPDYLNRFGTPKHPEDLGQHRCLRFRLGDERLYQWEFERGEEEVRTAVPGALILDEPGLILSLMERGADLMYGPETVLTHYVKRAKQLKCWMTGPMEPPGKRRML